MAQIPLTGGILGEPTLRDLSNHVVPEVDTKWYVLGLQLLDSKDTKVLSSIECDNRGLVETCCIKMFDRWLSTVATANWDRLITGLKAPSVKLHKLADTLAKQLGVQTDLNESHPIVHLQAYSQQGSPYHSSSHHSSPHNSISHHSTPSGSPELSHVPQVVEPPDDYVVEFSILVSRISEIIQNKSTATNLDSIKHALALVTVHKMSTQPLFSDAELEMIKESKDVSNIIEKCRKHWSWSSYSLLKLIVKKSGSNEAKQELRRFQQVVNIRQKVTDLGSNRLQDAKKYNEGYESLMVVLDEYYDDITVRQLEEAEKFLSSVTDLPSPEVMKLVECTKTNSVLIKWRIPSAVIPFVVMLAFQNKEEFIRRSFLRLTIAGMDVFNLCKPPTLQKFQLKCQEKDNEIHLLHDEIFRLGSQVKYLNKKCNALQDNWRQKKPTHYTTQQSDPTTQQSHHMTQQPRLDEVMGTSGGSLGSSYPPPVNSTMYGPSSALRPSFTPERSISPLPPPRSPPDPTFTTSTNVKERITTINNTITAEEQSTMHLSGRQAGSHQRFKRSKTPVTEHKEQRDELQIVFNKRSSKDMDEYQYEDYVQQKVSEQRINKPPQKYTTDEATTLIRKVQQERNYMTMYYEESN